MVAEREILDAVCQKLSEDEQKMLEMRLAGSDWAEIAVQCQTTPEAARKRDDTALDRAAGELGLTECPDGKPDRIFVSKQLTAAPLTASPRLAVSRARSARNGLGSSSRRSFPA